MKDSLKRLLQERGLTQAAIAAESGIHQGRISEYLDGKRKPGLVNLRRIARAMGVSADLLIGILCDESTDADATDPEETDEEAPGTDDRTNPYPEGEETIGGKGGESADEAGSDEAGDHYGDAGEPGAGEPSDDGDGHKAAAKGRE